MLGKAKTLKNIKYLIIFLAVITFVVGTYRVANADNGFSISTNVFRGISEFFEEETSIRSTTMSMITAMGIDAPLYGLIGCTSDALIDVIFLNRDSCSLRMLHLGSESANLNLRRNGSLMAFTAQAFDGFSEAPPPINLAYFINNASEESIVFRSAYAQEGSLNQYAAVLGAWRGIRNIAYGMLAVFVMAIAIMIVLRQKIDAQTVVTAQMAVPRIAISAVLIAFSYPLGSMFAQLIIPATKAGLYAINPDTFTSGGGFISTQCPTLIGASTIQNITSYATCYAEFLTRSLMEAGENNSIWADLGGLVILLIAVIVYLAVLIISLFVFIFNWCKIVLYTIFAPLIFAIGALPGQESRIKDWFITQLSSSLALASIFFCLMLGAAITLGTDWSGSTTVPGANLLVSVPMRAFVGPSITLIMGGLAIKAPGMIDQALKGPKKK